MIVRKIREYIDYKGLSFYEIENRLGVGRGTISKAVKEDKSIGTKIVENFLSIYNDINPEWLLTGRGEMLKRDVAHSSFAMTTQSICEYLLSQDEIIADLKKANASLMAENARLKKTKKK